MTNKQSMTDRWDGTTDTERVAAAERMTNDIVRLELLAGLVDDRTAGNAGICGRYGCGRPVPVERVFRDDDGNAYHPGCRPPDANDVIRPVASRPLSVPQPAVPADDERVRLPVGRDDIPFPAGSLFG